MSIWILTKFLELAHQFYYWETEGRELDVPLPKGWRISHRDEEENPSGQNMLHMDPRGAFTNLRVHGYVAHIKLQTLVMFPRMLINMMHNTP